MKLKILAKGKYLSLVQKDGWEFVRRVNCSGVVIILSTTKDKCILFVEQFRYPVGSFVVGFPAGLVGDDKMRRSEHLLTAAARELEEETGYRAKKLKEIYSGPVSAGMSSDMMSMVYASGLTKVGPGGGVGEHENIKVHKVPFGKAEIWLKSKRREGKIIGPNVYAGLFFLTRMISK